MSKRSRSMVGGSAVAAVLLVAIIGIATLIPPVVAENHRHSSVTGYFGLDDGGIPTVDRHGVMLVFDGAIAPETVSIDTFEVWLDEHRRAEVIESRVDDAYVFLRLLDELASDATPVIQMAEGEEVEDLAGNSTNRRKLGAVRVADGIFPRITVTLSGGSGTGTGDEGPDRLTNKTIDIQITSDEPLQGAPRVIVVCENIGWTESFDGRDVERDIDDFIANRNGPYAQRPDEPAGTTYTCGYDADGDGVDDPFELTEDIANSRPGETWEYAWRNPAGSTTMLRDGSLSVVAYGRDQSRYDRFGETVSNWWTGVGAFGLDTRFGVKGASDGIRIHPPNGASINEERPFVLLEFPEEVKVDLASAEFDGENVLDAFEVVNGNKFVYWPLSMNRGEHNVEIDAVDAAGNEISFDFEFATTQRGDFVMPLVAGWNAVSVPADPIDPEIENVFTDPAIEAVISWDRYEIENPWALSIRDDDRWEPWSAGRGVTAIQARSGYWVKSSRFIEQPIALGRGTAIIPKNYSDNCDDYWPSFWIFVGVFDEDGDQTEDDYGETLRRQDGAEVTAREYLGHYGRAYTWDAIGSRYEKLDPSDTMTIGDGVWVDGFGINLCP